MERLFLALSFMMTGCFPLLFGLYLAHRGDYLISVGCLLTSVCGFQQVYHTLKNRELFESLNKKILEQQVELDSCREEHGKQRKEITRNLAEVFSKKVEEEQEQLLRKHRGELAKASSMLEQKNKEIWQLKHDY